MKKGSIKNRLWLKYLDCFRKNINQINFTKGSNISVVLILLFLIFPLTITSQNNTEKEVAGDWVFNYEASLELMNEKAKQYYENMDANRQANVQEAYQNRKLSFGVGGVFSQGLANGHVIEGNWVLGEGNNLNISSPAGRVISFKVKMINDSTMILIPKKSYGGTANMLFSKWHLKKVIE